jgi:hypothetical protein
MPPVRRASAKVPRYAPMPARQFGHTARVKGIKGFRGRLAASVHGKLLKNTGLVGAAIVQPVAPRVFDVDQQSPLPRVGLDRVPVFTCIRQIPALSQQFFQTQPGDFAFDHGQCLNPDYRRIDILFACLVRQHDDVGLLFTFIRLALNHGVNRNLLVG